MTMIEQPTTATMGLAAIVALVFANAFFVAAEFSLVGARKTQLDLSDQDYATLGGYVFGQLGRLARPGDRLRVGPHILEVLEVEQRRVKAIRLQGAPVLARH